MLKFNQNLIQGAPRDKIKKIRYVPLTPAEYIFLFLEPLKMPGHRTKIKTNIATAFVLDMSV